ncbi:MAG: alpha/beta fold hydrolase [Lachnospiraceae bacterium]|nr:alpha/beta fold hydrolase [Lachnospiraceae bacterium]
MEKMLRIVFIAIMLLSLSACGNHPAEEPLSEWVSTETLENSGQADTETVKITYMPIPDEYRQASENPGQLERMTYDSSGGEKYAYVYVPYGYDAEDEETRYDILYLMHGGGGSAETYFGSDSRPDSFKNVIDNLIANGRMEPVLIVAPSFYPAGDSDASVSNAAALTGNFHKELTQDLIPAVESVYHTYAETVDSEGLAGSRSHRAFGGFSMGSVTTWYNFIHCLDYFGVFLPSSGDCWALGQMAGGSSPADTAEYLADIVRESGYTAEDFQIYAATGTEDIAYDMLNSQIEAMKELEDVFLYSDTAQDGNLHYILADGLTHTRSAACDYVYDVLPLIYPPEENAMESRILVETDYEMQEIQTKINGQTIYGVAYIPQTESEKMPLVICAHGLGASHRSCDEYASEFAAHGIAAYCFDFRGGGGNRSDGRMTDMSVMTEVSDLEAILEATKSWDFVNPERIAFLGESQGGIVSAIAAARHPEDICGVVLCYPAFLVTDAVHERFETKEDIEDVYAFNWITAGRAYAEDMWDYDVYEEIGSFDKKVLLMHGDRDGIVPVSYSEKAYDAYPDSDFYIISGAGHGFSGRHLDEAMEHIWDYFYEIGMVGGTR